MSGGGCAGWDGELMEQALHGLQFVTPTHCVCVCVHKCTPVGMHQVELLSQACELPGKASRKLREPSSVLFY